MNHSWRARLQLLGDEVFQQVGERLVLRPLSPSPDPFCVGVVTQIAVGHAALERLIEALLMASAQ